MKEQILFLILMLLPVVAKAYDACIDGIYYYFLENKAEVTSGSPKYSGDVIIPSSVSFNGTTYTVTGIGYHAFSGCSGLTSITIPESVASIGYDAFSGCSGLTSITIPNSVTIIGDDAFSGCSGLTSITIPESVTSIRSYAFSGCSGLTSITIPESVTSISSYAFSGCSGLTSITIPESVTSISSYAFSGCSSLTSVRLNSNSIVSATRKKSTSMQSIFGNQVKAYVIGSSVRSIGELAFSGCSALTSITIPESVTSIGNSAFSGCSGLTSITIPENVTRIGNEAFSGCKLHNVLIKCTTPPFCGSPFSEQTLYHTTLYVPTGCWDAYAYDDNWYRFINIRETAMAEEQVSEQLVYTLMDANTFAYSVYDPINNCIGTITSGGVDENNPNHNWQVINVNGSQCLYNIGAKKCVKSANDSFVLSSAVTPIEMENGDIGIIIGAQSSKQWALVSNERMNVEQAVITGIDKILSDLQESNILHDLNGRKLTVQQKGINIIRNSDGATRKVIIK